MTAKKTAITTVNQIRDMDEDEIVTATFPAGIRVRVDQTADGHYRAACECGWKGRDITGDAYLEAEAHQQLHAPKPTPCPDWCDEVTGHVWEAAGTYPLNEWRRMHHRTFGAVSVEQCEEADEDGQVESDRPCIGFDGDPLDDDITAERAERLGAEFTAAARFLRSIESQS